MGMRILAGLAADGPALAGLGKLRLIEATPSGLVAHGGDVFLVLHGRFDLRSPAALQRSPVDRLILSRDAAGEERLLCLEQPGLLLGELPGGPDGPLPWLLRGAGGAGWPALVDDAAS